MRLTMDSFTYTSNPGRVVFGSGTLARVAEEAERLDLKRLLVLGSPGEFDRSGEVELLLGERAAGRFADAQMHTPVDVTNKAMELVADLKPDGVVSIGGGSTTGLSKAIAVRTDLPQIVIPTTYAGSEMTPILGETENGVKTTRSHPAILPEVVIYDVNLTLDMPARLTATSGMNAMAHAVEALYSRERNPVISLMALEAIKSLFTALPRIAENPADPEARTRTLYGAWLCGVCLGTVGMALHHKLCHTLGGSFDLPHAETHSVILPHALAYNLAVLPELDETLSLALGTNDPARAIYDLERQLNIPAALSELGMPESGIAQASELALSNPYWNPRPLEREAIERLLFRAWAGEPPAD
jgi:alcohol dehydrogenase class IV